MSIYTEVTNNLCHSLGHLHLSVPFSITALLGTEAVENSGLACLSLKFLTIQLLIHWKKTTWHLM